MLAIRCKKCGRAPMRGSDFCWYHDPATTEEEKFKARSKGGRNSRTIPHDIDPESVLPIETPADLKFFYNVLLSVSLREPDTTRMITNAMKIAPQLGDALQLELIESLSSRIEILEAKKAGKLVDSQPDLFLTEGNDDDKADA